MSPRRTWKVYIDWELREPVRILTAKTDSNIMDIVEAAIRAYLANGTKDEEEG